MCRFNSASTLNKTWPQAAALAAVLVAVPAPEGVGGSVAAPYEVGTWHGFRAAAVSYTFDDNTPNQYAVAVPLFNASGFRMTLFTVTTWLPGGSWAPIAEAATFGHEIASHTVTHAELSGLYNALQTAELQGSHDSIRANASGRDGMTIAYPFCTPGNPALLSQYYIAARTCSGQLTPSTPPDFLAISSFICGREGTVNRPQDFRDIADNAAAANAWCVFLIHAIDGDPGYSPLSSRTLQSSLDYLAANPDAFWVDTFGNVVRYIRERIDVSVREIAAADNAIALNVTDTLDDTVYDQPITIRRPLPTNWSAAAVTQNGSPVPTRIRTIADTDYVQFDVVPDRGEILLSRASPPATIRGPLQASSSNLTFRIEGDPGSNAATYASTDLAAWSPIQTNTLSVTTTTVLVEAPASPSYYRIQWAPAQTSP
jgi:oligosaccharide reducing-end xylanase